MSSSGATQESVETFVTPKLFVMELVATLTISHFKEAPLPENHTLAKWGLP